MATAVEFLLSGFTDNSGRPLALGKVYTYDAGTNTLKDTYTDSAGTIPSTNPVELDSNGRKQIYADGAYKFVIKTAADVTLYTFDNLFFGAGVSGLAQSFAGAKTFEDDLTLDANLIFSAAAAKVIAGATSLSFRNNADSASNLTLLNAGEVAIRNNHYFQARNNANSAYLNLIGTDASDNTEIYATGLNKLLEFYLGATPTRRVYFQEVTTAGPVLSPRLYFVGDTDSDIRIGTDTVDGADNNNISFHSGGQGGNDRGAAVYYYGNEHALYPGKIIAVAGDAATSQYIVRANQDVLITNQAKVQRYLLDIATGNVTLSGNITVATDIIIQGANAKIRQFTDDGTDDRMVSLSGGGETGIGRGATLFLYGNEYTSIGGNAYLITGDTVGSLLVLRAAATGGEIQFQKVSGLVTWAIHADGSLQQDAASGNLIVFNAANTTFDFVGAMGNSSKNPTSDAPADWVEIKIAGVTRYIPVYAA